MQKKLLSILIFLILVVSFLFAANEITEPTDFGYVMRLLYESERVIDSPNNKVLMDEIGRYDWNWIPKDSRTTDYQNTFNSIITNTKMIAEKRERLDYIYSQKKKTALAAAVPNPLSVIGVVLTGGGNPLKAIISVGSMALSSVANYTTQKQQNELELIEKNWELDDAQTQELSNLRNFLCSYISELGRTYGYKEEDIPSLKTLEKFINDLQKQDPSSRLLALSSAQYKKELKVLPQYWQELAKAAFELEKYAECLNYINEYVKCYTKVIKHDEDYAKLMEIKAYCLLETDESFKTDATRVDEIANAILDNSIDASYELKYFVAELYKTCYGQTKNIEYGRKSVQLLLEVCNSALEEYLEDVKKFNSGEIITEGLNGIETNINDLNDEIAEHENALKQKNLGKTSMENYKSRIKEDKEKIVALKENKKEYKKLESQMLPPDISFLYSILNEYYNVVGSLKTADRLEIEDSLEYKVLTKKMNETLYSTFLREVLYNEEKAEKYCILTPKEKGWLLNKKLTLTIDIPASYFIYTKEYLNDNENATDTLSLIIDGYSYDLGDFEYTFEKNKDNNNDSCIRFEVTLEKKISIDGYTKTNSLPSVKVAFNSSINPYKDYYFDARCGDLKTLLEFIK